MNHLIRSVTFAVILLLLCLPASAAGPGVAHTSGNQLAGAWEVNVNPDPGSGVPAVLNIALISRDGQIINTDSSEGTALGGWNHERQGIYSVTFYGFIPAAGLRHRVTAEVTLSNSGNTFSGPFRTDVYDMSGTFLFSFEGQVNASRLPLP